MLTKTQWARKKRRKKHLRLAVFTFLIMIMISTVMYMGLTVLRIRYNSSEGFYQFTKTINKPLITELLLTPNDYSRPQTPITKVNSIVIHYTANPGTRAEANRNYFENLKTQQTTSASSHFIIGLEGEIIQCVPLDEISFASNDRNLDTISIECCHPDETGEFNDKTYASLVELVAWLCVEFNLDKKDIIRHYDVSGKLCPLYYVENEDKWEEFKEDVMRFIDVNAFD